jgi:phosphohistidine phosphatase
MKSLHLLRHAKSSWKDPGLNDHDRPLNKRGRQTAKMMAAYFRRAKIAPDLVICSTAVRAHQTLDPIIKALHCLQRLLGHSAAVTIRGLV